MPAAALTIPAAVPEVSLEQRFALLVARHRERVIRLAWRLSGGDRATAEDLAQEAFVRAWEALPQFREEAALSSWLYRIVTRLAANHRRWSGVRTFWHGVLGAGRSDAVDPVLGDAALRRRLDEALSRLSVGQREAFVLVHLEGFTLQEAAGITGRAEGTLKSHLHRALTTLRTELAALIEKEEP